MWKRLIFSLFRPAFRKIRGPVDVIVKRTAEGEIIGQQPLDRRQRKHGCAEFRATSLHPRWRSCGLRVVRSIETPSIRYAWICFDSRIQTIKITRQGACVAACDHGRLLRYEITKQKGGAP